MTRAARDATEGGQMVLPFGHQPAYTAADFLHGACNAAAWAWLEGDVAWPQGRLALWGGPGTGKTHLLHIWAGRRRALLVAGAALPPGPPRLPLAIDDADASPEHALLHLLNAAAEAACPVLLAARTPPSRWPVALPDLASRLRAMTAVELATPDDALLAALFARLCAERQFAVPQPVQDWLRLRLPRTPAALREAAARLDAASLRAGRAVTQAFAARALAGMLTEAAEPATADHEDFAPSPTAACTAPPCRL